MATVLDRLRRDLAAKLADALEAVTRADAGASTAAATREAAQSSVNEIEAILRPIEARAEVQGTPFAPFLKLERETAQGMLKAAKAAQVIAAKALTTAEAALADLRLAENQLSAGQSRGHGGGPSVPSASQTARHVLLHKQDAQAAILSQGLANARQ